MANASTRVVITGVGAITPVGADAPTTWQSLLAGRSGVRTLTYDWAQRLPCQIAAPSAVEPTTIIDRVQARREANDPDELIRARCAEGALGERVDREVRRDLDLLLVSS